MVTFRIMVNANKRGLKRRAYIGQIIEFVIIIVNFVTFEFLNFG